MFSHRGLGLAAPTAPDLKLRRYFQEPSSRSCAIDCRGREIIESHSPQTATRTFENVTRERFNRMSLLS